MPVIRKLSAEIIGQIAAGEVVERPASAVKELVENSIDAGAHNVTVELREGGIKYLRVTDNGCGIPAEQVRLAFERHATSKIAAAADLYNIHTLGFRGEALASIATVSRVTLTTRTQEAPFGTRAVVEAGEFTDIRQAASPVGTTIVVEDLFCNTPVRLKFLKKPAVEASLVADYMQRLILSRPDVAFRFVSQSKTVYHSMGDGSVESALYSLYGREAFGKMRKVSGHMNGVLLSGYVGAGDLARGNRQQQSFFVNGRFFRSQPLSRALEEGCGLMQLHAPLRIEADENGNACALWAQPQIIGKIDAWGRAKVSAAAKEPVRIAADVVVVAIGQGIETRHFEQAGMSVKRGNLAALPDGMVSDLPGVFAGGDCVTGPATVIRAIAAGKVAAANIDNYLGFNHLISVDVDIPAAISEDKHHCARVNLGEKDAQERKDNFEHIECGMTAQEAAQECGRCLRCDHYGYGIFKGGRAAIW